MTLKVSMLASAISLGICALSVSAQSTPVPPTPVSTPTAAASIAGANTASVTTANGSKTASANKRLAEVKVQASALTESTSIQSSQQQIGSEQLERQQASNLADMLRYVPGVEVSNIGRFGSTGINIRGLEGDQIAMTVDGMALGETLDPASFASYDFFRVGRGGLDPAALKQLNVLKGADAITVGSGSLAGAVQFVTKDPVDFLPQGSSASYARIKAEYNGSNHEWMKSAILAGREQALEGLLVLTRRDGHETQSYRRYDAATGPARTVADPSEHQNDNLLAKLVYQLAPAHQVGITADIQANDSQLQNLSRQDQVYLFRHGDDSTERQRYSLRYEHSASTLWYDLLNAQYDQQHSKNSGLTTMLMSTGCPQALAPCLRSEDRSFTQDAEQFRLELTKELSSDVLTQQWFYGGTLQQKTVNFSAIDRRYLGQTSQLVTTEVDPALVPDTDVREYALFARNTLSMNANQTQLTLGARYDQLDYQPNLNQAYQDPTNTVKNVDFSAVSWQSQLKQQLDAKQSVTLQVGRGFRAPTVEDLYVQTSTTTAIEAVSKRTVTLLSHIANPDLTAERSLSVELAYQFELDNLRQKVAIFQDKYSNLIETLQIVQNPQTSYQSCFRGMCTISQGAIYTQPANTGEAKVKGIELEGHWLASAHWRLQWSGAYQQGENAKSEPMLSIMPWTAALGVGYDIPNTHGRVLLNSRFQKAKAAADTERLDSRGQLASSPYLSNSAAIFDASLQWDITPQLQLTAGIYNLLDKQYYRWERVRFVNPSPSALFGGVVGNGIERFSEPGRYGKLGLSYVF